MKLNLLSRTCVALTVALSCSVLAAATPGSIVFILDCSKSTGNGSNAEQKVQPVSDSETASRFQAARETLRKLLMELSQDGNHQVGVWLYGHRIVWEADVKEPDLLMQDDYLTESVGYAALNELLPGDDVERLQPLLRFTLQEYEAITPRLDALKPWGEKPLYLAVTRALEDLADAPAGAPKSIVVLTDGGNQQWLARFKTSHRAVIGTLDRNLVPIHILHYGPKPEGKDADDDELRQLATHAGGDLKYVDNETEIVLSDLLGSAPPKATPAPAPVQETASATDAAAPATPKTAEAAAPMPSEQTISGSVVYYGRPVTTATVTLEGTAISAKTDRQGRFILRNVPAGKQYKVVINAVALNKYRDKTVDLNVEANPKEPLFLAIDLK